MDEGGGSGGGIGSRLGTSVARGVGAPAPNRATDNRVRVASRAKVLKKLLDFVWPARKPKSLDLLTSKGKRGRLDGKLDELQQEEKDFIEEMLSLGNDVKVIPRSKDRTADFELNGIVYERKKLSRVVKTDSDGISSAMSSTILNARGQSSRIIIDGRQQPGMTREIAERGIRRALYADKNNKIDEIMVLTPEGTVARFGNK